MAETEVTIGYGSKFAISTDDGSTYTDVAEISGDISPPSSTIDTVDATHMRSPNGDREFILGLNDPGEMSFSINFIPGGATDTLLIDVKASKARVKCRITFPNGVVWGFSGLLTKYQPTVPVDGKMTADITFKVTGSTSVTAEAAPTNTIIPAIAGVPTVGQVLTALEGVWTGAPDFTYVWKRDGTTIAGATSRTYTLAGADATKAVTVTVTGTNSAGNASATSGATAAVGT